MIYIKPILEKNNKRASDFLNYLNDERRNLELEKFKDRNMVRIDANNGSGGHIYIDKDLEPVLNDFLKLK